MIANNKKIHILQVIHSMDRGGIENWLMNLLRHIDRDLYQIDFLVHTNKPCDYDKEIYDLGSKIIRCPHPTKPFKYARDLKKLLKKYGPYDVVHSNTHHFSGWVLRIAHQMKIPIRIAHSHNDISYTISHASLHRKIYYTYTEYLIKKYATNGLAASTKAASSLFGNNWETDPRWQILLCRIDLSSFNKSIDKSLIREKLGIPPGAFVVGNVSRFAKQKNHPFIIDIFSEIVRQEPTSRLLLVGDGKLMSHIKYLAKTKNIFDNIIFTGSRDDVAELMLGAMDFFLFPSLWEGLGIAIVEAQAAGLPCILSETIPPEADIVSPLISRISLSQTAKEWADIIIKVQNEQKKASFSKRNAFKLVCDSPFNIANGQAVLESLYQSKF